MKTIDEVIIESYGGYPHLLNIHFLKKAMKKYANQKLDEAAEKAKAQLISNNESVWYSDAWAEVDKQSILSLKYNR